MNRETWLTRLNVVALSTALFFSGVGSLQAQTGPSAASDWGESATREAGTRQTLTIKGVECAFRWCPAGEFMMGSPESEEGRYECETQHRVKLRQGFWLLETEATQELWTAVMGTGIEEQTRKFVGEYGKEFNLEFPEAMEQVKKVGVGNNYPMYFVSWEDCREFVVELNKLTVASGVQFRLPCEVEWEYACRAGTTGAFCGDDLDSLGWYDGNSRDRAHPVKEKEANAWGLYDMHGNVWEWCEDLYGAYPASASTEPADAENCSERVIRGGCWNYDARNCRSAARNNVGQSLRFDNLGVRLLLSSSK